jgi:hypothetical protein
MVGVCGWRNFCNSCLHALLWAKIACGCGEPVFAGALGDIFVFPLRTLDKAPLGKGNQRVLDKWI